MRKDERNNVRREKTIMVVSSVFVLAALTAAGVYMRNQTRQSKDDGYTIDFQGLEESTEDKWREIAQQEKSQQEEILPNDDLDYMPLEVGADDITIPGISDKWGKGVTATPTPSPKPTAKPRQTPDSEKPETTVSPGQETGQIQDEPVETAAKEPEAMELHFDPADFTRPVSGEVLIPYSMNSSVYFATLDQYKYHPAVVLSARQGETVSACLPGEVVNIYDSSEFGHMLVLELGDGYQAVYGQLEDIKVSVGAYVEAGTVLGSIAAPTKYYSVEGSNLYFQLLKNKECVDPTPYLK